ncbi:MAG: hypothetical protein QM844_18415, partial [Planctomycetota bacterium]|nr:hypothetical protein [Planctomycetota bacterium]
NRPVAAWTGSILAAVESDLAMAVPPVAEVDDCPVFSNRIRSTRDRQAAQTAIRVSVARP